MAPPNVSSFDLVRIFDLRRIQFARAVDTLNVDKGHAQRMGDDEGSGAWGGGGDDDDDGKGATSTPGGGFFQGIIQGIIHRMISFVIGVALLGSCCCCSIAVAFFFPSDPYVGEFTASGADGKTIQLNTTKETGVYTDESGKPALFKLFHDKDKKTIKLVMNDNAVDFWNGKSAVAMTYTGNGTLVGDGKTFTKVDPPIGAANKKSGGADRGPAVVTKPVAETKKDVAAKDADSAKRDTGEKTTK